MIKEYINSQKETIINLWDLYENQYESLQEKVNNNETIRNFFSGSSEQLCVFEPSLINALQCDWCLKGDFREKKPQSSEYHELIWNKNEELIKIIYHYDTGGGEKNKEFFWVVDGFTTIIAGYVISNSEAYILSEIYLLNYDETKRLLSFIHAPLKTMIDASGEIHTYKDGRLYETLRFSLWESKFERFEFDYNESAFLKSYKMWNLNQDLELFYNVLVSKKEIVRFLKKGRYYFTPDFDRSGDYSIPVKKSSYRRMK